MTLENQMTWEEIVNHVAEKVNGDNKFKKWMLTKENVGYLADYHLWKRAYLVQKALSEDYDHFTVITGKEGLGKSFLASIYCSMVSNSFCLNNICFELRAGVEQIRDAKKGDSVLLDEGAMFLFSRESMSDANRIMMKLFTLIRQRNIHLCICIPNFYIIDSYIRDHRVDTMLNIIRRGGYNGFNKSAINIISKEGKDTKNIYKANIPSGTSWKGYWRNKFPTINNLNLEAYKEHKRSHLESFFDEIIKQVDSSSNGTTDYITIPEFARKFGLKQDTVRSHIKKGIIKAHQLGQKYLIKKTDVINFNKTGKIG